jgi:hypothetical protein
MQSCCGPTRARAPQDLEKALEPIFFFFKQRRAAGEPFGDFCARVGFDAIRDYTKVTRAGCRAGRRLPRAVRGAVVTRERISPCARLEAPRASPAAC